MSIDFQGRVAIVTGAGGGLGKQHALALAKRGAKVLVNDLGGNVHGEGGSVSAAQAVVDEIISAGGEAIANGASVTDYEAVQAMVKQAMDKWGRVDILVNNAGITRDTLLMRMTEEQWDEVINTNLKSAFNLTKAVQKPMLKARSGSIINMSSVVGVKGNAGQSNYAASKAGLIGFTKSIAAELGSRNIRCNAIAPGFIETEMTEVLDQEVVASWRNSIPLKRGGQPVDVANATVFLASDLSAYITGQTLHVCGGMLM
jgi:3-oxoacyl-[acyl-carrier protein] reductase